MLQPSRFFRSLFLLLLLNALVKPVWLFFIDRKVQLLTGDAYGDYFSLLHLTLIPAALADAGILAFYTRAVASDPVHAAFRFRYFLRLKVFLSIIYIAIALLLAVLFGTGQTKIILLLALLQVAGSFYLFFRSHIAGLQLFTADAFFSVADKALVVLLAGGIIYLPLPVSMNTALFIEIQIGAFVLATVAALVFLAPKLKTVNHHAPANIPFKKEWKDALPYALVVLLMTILYRFDAFLLYHLHPNGQQEAAKYAAGFRILDALNMAGFLVAAFLLPLLSRGGERIIITGIIKNCTAIMLLYAAMAAGFCWFNREAVSNILYGTFYAGAPLIIGTCVSGILGCSMVHIFSTLLTAEGKVKILSVCAGIFAALNILANLIVIPKYGALGVAAVAACGQLLFAIALIGSCYYKKMAMPAPRFWLFAITIPLSIFLVFRLTGSMPAPVQLIAVAVAGLMITIGLKLVSPDIYAIFRKGYLKKQV